jgi:hypothetical protein
LGSVEILFYLYSFILCGSLENDPLSLTEGEAAQGGHPLDPLFFPGYISTLSGVLVIGGIPEWRGRKHEKLEPPRAIVCFSEDFNRAEICINPLFFVAISVKLTMNSSFVLENHNYYLTGNPFLLLFFVFYLIIYQGFRMKNKTIDSHIRNYPKKVEKSIVKIF